MKLAAVAVALLLSGCVNRPHWPVSDVAVMPNDCANIAAIERWLEQQSAVSQATFQSTNEYVQQRSQIRHRLWTLRYNCRAL